MRRPIMQAAILNEKKQLELRDLPRPKIVPGGVLIKVVASGLCGADLKMIDKGHKALTYPRVLGHEITGIIVESETKEFNKGDRVQIAPGIVCGECYFCQQGITNHCQEIEIFGFTVDGGFREYIAIPEKAIKAGVLNIIPDNLSFSEAVFAEPLACCINGLELAQFTENESVLIIGAGPIGCLKAMLAKSYGAKKIILADKLAKRLDFAASLELDSLINVEEKAWHDIVNKATDGRGVDLIVLASSHVSVDHSLTGLLNKRGKILLFSGFADGKENLEIDGNLFHYGEMALIGAYGCTVKQNKKALKLMAKQKIAVKKLITDQISLNEIFKGVEKARNKETIKVIIKENEGGNG